MALEEPVEPKSTIFAPITSRAQPAGWWSVLVVILIFAFAFIVALIGILITGVVMTFSQPDAFQDPEAFQDPAFLTPIITTFVAMFFPALAGGAMFCTKVVERRSLASMGFSGSAKLFKYGRGVLLGAVLAGALAGVAALAGLLLGIDAGVGVSEDVALDFSRLAEPVFLQFFVVVFVLILIQGGAEEVLFRGWMLSSMALRAGLPAALVVSSIAFGLAHADRLLVSLTAGLGVLLGTSVVGVAFARLAMAEKGVFGACGAHGGYNFVLIAGSFAGLIAASDAPTPAGVLAEFLAEMRQSLQEVSVYPVIAAQVVVFGLLAAVLWRAGRPK